jgi:hypothetical protein
VPPSNTALIQKIKDGTVTLTELQAGAIQRGATGDDYELNAGGCPDTGNGCVNLYAVSVAGVTPSRFITWFQATAAARNAGKRLPTNAEWQAGALGTPDGAPCKLGSGVVGSTGTAGCESDVGAFDLVGNLGEWVADWVPPAAGDCGTELFAGTGDRNCLAGTDQAAGTSALIRGGHFLNSAGAGVFTVDDGTPSDASIVTGFRAAR